MAAILVDIGSSSTNAVHVQVQVQVQILGFGTTPTTRGTANVRSRSTLDIVCAVVGLENREQRIENLIDGHGAVW